RLVGSFLAMASQGRSALTSSSTSGRSSSTGAGAVLMALMSASPPASVRSVRPSQSMLCGTTRPCVTVRTSMVPTPGLRVPIVDLGDGTALLTDRYELTMLQAALREGTAERRSVFEVFARSLPAGRRYGVVAGTGRLLDAIEAFRFTPAHLDFLASDGIVDEP